MGGIDVEQAHRNSFASGCDLRSGEDKRNPKRPLPERELREAELFPKLPAVVAPQDDIRVVEKVSGFDRIEQDSEGMVDE
jgi:hypothetical protein